MIRSLAREYQRTRDSENHAYVARLKRERDKIERDMKEVKCAYIHLRNAICEKYGHKALKELQVL